MSPGYCFKHVHLSYLRRISDNQKDIINNYIETFFKEAPHYIRLLEQNQEKSNWQELRNNVHALKALMNFMGAETAEEILQEMRNCVINQSGIEKLNKLKKKFLSEYNHISKELKKILDENIRKFYD